MLWEKGTEVRRIYGCINPRSYVEAMRLERKVAARLKRRWFAVWQR